MYSHSPQAAQSEQSPLLLASPPPLVDEDAVEQQQDQEQPLSRWQQLYQQHPRRRPSSSSYYYENNDTPRRSGSESEFGSGATTIQLPVPVPVAKEVVGGLMGSLASGHNDDDEDDDDIEEEDLNIQTWIRNVQSKSTRDAIMEDVDVDVDKEGDLHRRSTSIDSAALTCWDSTDNNMIMSASLLDYNGDGLGKCDGDGFVDAADGILEHLNVILQEHDDDDDDINNNTLTYENTNTNTNANAKMDTNMYEYNEQNHATSTTSRAGLVLKCVSHAPSSSSTLLGGDERNDHDYDHDHDHDFAYYDEWIGEQVVKVHHPDIIDLGIHNKDIACDDDPYPRHNIDIDMSTCATACPSTTNSNRSTRREEAHDKDTGLETANGTENVNKANIHIIHDKKSKQLKLRIYIQAWYQHVVEWTSRNDSLVNWFHATRKRQRLKDIVSQWKKNLQHQQQQREKQNKILLVEEFFQWRNRIILERILCVWYNHTRATLYEIETHKYTFMRRKVLSYWKAHMQHMKQKSHQAMGQYTSHLLTLSWRRWYDDVMIIKRQDEDDDERRRVHGRKVKAAKLLHSIQTTTNQYKKKKKKTLKKKTNGVDDQTTKMYHQSTYDHVSTFMEEKNGSNEKCNTFTPTRSSSNIATTNNSVHDKENRVNGRHRHRHRGGEKLRHRRQPLNVNMNVHVPRVKLGGRGRVRQLDNVEGIRDSGSNQGNKQRQLHVPVRPSDKKTKQQKKGGGNRSLLYSSNHHTTEKNLDDEDEKERRRYLAQKREEKRIMKQKQIELERMKGAWKLAKIHHSLHIMRRVWDLYVHLCIEEVRLKIIKADTYRTDKVLEECWKQFRDNVKWKKKQRLEVERRKFLQADEHHRRHQLKQVIRIWSDLAKYSKTILYAQAQYAQMKCRKKRILKIWLSNLTRRNIKTLEWKHLAEKRGKESVRRWVFRRWMAGALKYQSERLEEEKIAAKWEMVKEWLGDRAQGGE